MTWSQDVVEMHTGSTRTAVVDPGGPVTGAELIARAAFAADLLTGLAPTGVAVPALLTTHADSLALVLAGAAAGRPLAPLGPRLTAAELAGPVAASGSGVLLTEPEWAPVATRVAELTGVRVVVLEPLRTSADPLPNPEPAEPAETGTAFYLHTAGTTGTAKRIPVTQRVLEARTRTLCGLVGLGPDSRYATGSPLHHIGGMGNTLVALTVGATVLATSRFTLEWWRGLRDLGATHCLLVPSMIEMLLAERSLDLVPLRTLIYGASPISPDTLRTVLTVLPGVRLVNLFGQTEGSPITCLTAEDHVRAAAADRSAEHLLATVGRAVPGLRLRIDQPDADGIGEVLAAAEHLCAPAADGWLHTSDLGRLDADGYLHLVGRRHDMVVRGGENVYPVEVEHVLAGHPGVAAVGVVGVPDRRLGETLAAFVVPADPDRPVPIEQLRDFARERLAGFKVPTHWYRVDALPQNAAGKLVRGELRRRHSD